MRERRRKKNMIFLSHSLPYFLTHSLTRPHSLTLTRPLGQSTLEYAVVLAAVVAALLSMQIYMKRGIAGRLRGAADSIGDQYAPRHASSNFTLAVNGMTQTKQQLLLDQSVTRVINGVETTMKVDLIETTTTIPAPGEKVTRTGSERVASLADEALWEP